MKWTTIRVSLEVKQELDKLKLYPEEPYDKVLRRLIGFVNYKKRDFLKWIGLSERTINYYKKALEKLEKLK